MAEHKQATAVAEYQWLRTGDVALSAMLDAIEAAREFVLLETYIVSDSLIAQKFRGALEKAAQRGVRVRVLVDALGSMTLPTEFWKPLVDAGGEFRWFNPLQVFRLGLRDHRKVLVCDDVIAFIGGFNIAPEYEGDGVLTGWRDLGMSLTGPLVVKLRKAFDDMFERAPFEGRILLRPRRLNSSEPGSLDEAQLLMSGPGHKQTPMKSGLLADMRKAQEIRIICAYFLPTWSIRRLLMKRAREGALVQLILAGKSDVPLSQLAARSLYRKLLTAGVQIFEYQPQILHAKLFIFDDAVYAGSANLDTRSLHINYELLVRIRESRVVAEAVEIFNNDLRYSEKVTLPMWHEGRNWLSRWLGRLAYFILARLDPYLTGRQIRLLKWFKVIRPAKG